MLHACYDSSQGIDGAAQIAADRAADAPYR
jgi:hypothetical protein